MSRGASSRPRRSPSDAAASVFRRDGDREWTSLDGLPSESMPYALCTDSALPHVLWTGLADGSVWHSADRGATWDAPEGALPAVERAMVMLPPSGSKTRPSGP